jgi:hypothetical protein
MGFPISGFTGKWILFAGALRSFSDNPQDVAHEIRVIRTGGEKFTGTGAPW